MIKVVTYQEYNSLYTAPFQGYPTSEAAVMDDHMKHCMDQLPKTGDQVTPQATDGSSQTNLSVQQVEKANRFVLFIIAGQLAFHAAIHNITASFIHAWQGIFHGSAPKESIPTPPPFPATLTTKNTWKKASRSDSSAPKPFNIALGKKQTSGIPNSLHEELMMKFQQKADKAASQTPPKNVQLAKRTTPLRKKLVPLNVQVNLKRPLPPIPTSTQRLSVRKPQSPLPQSGIPLQKKKTVIISVNPKSPRVPLSQRKLPALPSFKQPSLAPVATKTSTPVVATKPASPGKTDPKKKTIQVSKKLLPRLPLSQRKLPPLPTTPIAAPPPPPPATPSQLTQTVRKAKSEEIVTRPRNELFSHLESSLLKRHQSLNQIDDDEDEDDWDNEFESIDNKVKDTKPKDVKPIDHKVKEEKSKKDPKPPVSAISKPLTSKPAQPISKPADRKGLLDEIAKFNVSILKKGKRKISKNAPPQVQSLTNNLFDNLMKKCEQFKARD